MAYALQWVRSLIYIVTVYASIAVVGIVLFPWALVSQRGARVACMSVCRFVQWIAPFMIGLRMEIRGTPPDYECVVASKHQSFLDVFMVFSAIPAGKFIMKRILIYSPIVGQYGLRIGCIPVDRGKRAAAIKQMVEAVRKGKATRGQLIIYPQGTRIAPGVKAPYKIGTAVLYEQLGQPCVPVAANVGLFWPKRGIYRKQGTAVVEFLEPIQPGMARDEFLKLLETRIETASNRLNEEAGFHAPH
ncbi:lysophospholipid acyltransferase family protein [Marivita sp. XM-24bin2]|jgi:1-acyl-sn-glycerol-3-phosphate acyltransferase|uniref:lysophospholipid acyltransferase family protein n=1 Tax=unclassified Marivita TaxID=2632480 RepID=UPI000D790020|nr:lysophospholipid acyltransferase family protein [Marivita sp. XM-24bin2]MCR9108239.1 1-acyl-sn-glycerol-3-phosphate acyltransferase [Paracoccaceae bacterium]PWL37145.1 MAG: 1-acyl-sn-glycerol-3-phosphate acyltransferase [Marivita sp. XM-24bin2]